MVKKTKVKDFASLLRKTFKERTRYPFWKKKWLGKKHSSEGLKKSTLPLLKVFAFKLAFFR